jgi:hypothetical protein
MDDAPQQYGVVDTGRGCVHMPSEMRGVVEAGRRMPGDEVDSIAAGGQLADGDGVWLLTHISTCQSGVP